MTRQEREDIAKCVCNFYQDAASHSVKATINYFKKRDIPERTIRYILKKYLTYGTRGAESAGKMKNFPVRQKYFQKMSPKGKMFSSRETFFPRKKKNFSKISPRYINFQNFPRTAVRARG